MKDTNLASLVLGYHNLKSYDEKLIDKSHYITDAIARKLYGIDFKGIKKIAIDLLKNNNSERFLLNEQVLLIRSDLSFFNTTLEKLHSDSNEIIKVIQRALEKTAVEYQLDQIKITEVMKSCYNGGYSSYFYGPTVYSFSRTHFARIFCTHNSQNVDLNLVIYNSETNEELFRKHLYKKGSFISSHCDFFGKLKYVETGDKFVYSSKAGGKVSVSIQSETVEFQSPVKKKEKDYLKLILLFFLAVFLLGTLYSFIKWLAEFYCVPCDHSPTNWMFWLMTALSFGFIIYFYSKKD